MGFFCFLMEILYFVIIRCLIYAMSNFDNYQISNNFKIQGFWGTSLKQALDEKNQ